MAEIAAALGTPLMPWQRHVSDVALEIDPATRLLVYREIVLTVPRQSGKTTWLLSLMVHRALGFNEPQRITYTAQNRNSARAKWQDEHVKALERSPFSSLFTTRSGLGQEAIMWTNGSHHGIESNTERAGHGVTLDLGVIDEAFAHDDNRVEQAMKPAMITRPQPQLVIVSTAGVSGRATYLRGKVNAGRARTAAGVTTGNAFFEWSASPADDPMDPATWRTCMPALGHTVRESAIEADAESMDPAEFRRAYLNIWGEDAPAENEWTVIPEAAWAALVDRTPAVMDGPVAFGLDVTLDRAHAAISAAFPRDGGQRVEVIDHRPGVGWAVERLAELNRRWKPVAVVVDGVGPAASLITPLQQAGVEVQSPATRDVGRACAAFYDGVLDTRSVWHGGQPSLDAALAGARKRTLGESGWAWGRKGSHVDISPLVAATLAVWGLATFGGSKNSDWDAFLALNGGGVAA